MFLFSRQTDLPTCPSVMDTVEDVLCIRPLGFVRVIIEAVAFGVSLPVTAPLKKVEEAREFLIEGSLLLYLSKDLWERCDYG